MVFHTLEDKWILNAATDGTAVAIRVSGAKLGGIAHRGCCLRTEGIILGVWQLALLKLAAADDAISAGWQALMLAGAVWHAGVQCPWIAIIAMEICAAFCAAAVLHALEDIRIFCAAAD